MAGKKKKNGKKGLPPRRPPDVEVLLPTDRDLRRQVEVELKEMFKMMMDHLAPDVEGWIRATADGGAPDKATQLVLGLAEYCLPKLARLEVDITKLSDDDLLRELQRREEEDKARRAESLIVEILPNPGEAQA